MENRNLVGSASMKVHPIHLKMSGTLSNLKGLRALSVSLPQKFFDYAVPGQGPLV